VLLPENFAFSAAAYMPLKCPCISTSLFYGCSCEHWFSYSCSGTWLLPAVVAAAANTSDSEAASLQALTDVVLDVGRPPVVRLRGGVCHYLDSVPPVADLRPAVQRLMEAQGLPLDSFTTPMFRSSETQEVADGSHSQGPALAGGSELVGALSTGLSMEGTSDKQQAALSAQPVSPAALHSLQPHILDTIFDARQRTGIPGTLHR
jgi:hypothetical protein